MISNKGMKKTGRKRMFFLLWISSAALCGVFTQYVSDESNLSKMTPLYRLPVFAVLTGILLFWNREKLDPELLRVRSRTDTGYAVFSGAVLAIAALFFYKSWKTVPETAAAAALLGVKGKILAGGMAGALAILAWPALLYYLRALLERTLQVRQTVLAEKRYLLKGFLVLSAVFCFSIVAIVRSDFIYKDDMQRLVWGSTLYSRESRFLAEYVSTALHMDLFFADISPLGQFLEMVLIAAAAIIVFSAVSRRKPGFYDLAAMLPFGLTPYFLEGVAFKYDPPQHAFAVLFSVLPFLYYRGERRQFLLLTVVCIPVSCTFHQVPMGYYLSVLLVLSLLDWARGERSGRETLQRGLSSFAVYFAGLMIYRFGILHTMPSRQSYMTTRIWDLQDLPSGILQNYRTFFSHILSDFSPLWLGLTAVLCVSFVVLITRNSVRGKGRTLAAAILVLMCLILLSYSLYPLLTFTQYSPRHMYAFGLMIGLLSVTAVSECGDRGVPTKTASVLLGICFITFAFTFGNALSEQKNYTETRVRMVVDSLTEIISEDPEQEYVVKVTGDVGLAPPIKAMPDTMNMVRRLVPTMFSEYFAGWQAIGLYNYYGLPVRMPEEGRDPDYADLDLEVREKNYFYTVSMDGNYILVDLIDR